VNLPAGQFAQATISCNTGDHATGGGWSDGSENVPVAVEESVPRILNNAPAGWMVNVLNTGTQSLTLHAWTVCVHY
jgi:hypothetical protein